MADDEQQRDNAKKTGADNAPVANDGGASASPSASRPARRSFDGDEEGEDAVVETNTPSALDYMIALWPVIAVATPLIGLALATGISFRTGVSLYAVLDELDSIAMIQIAFLLAIAAVVLVNFPNICRSLLGAPGRHRSFMTRNTAWFLFLPPALWTIDYFYLQNPVFQLIIVAELVITVIAAIFLYRQDAHKDAVIFDLVLGVVKAVTGFVVYVFIFAHIAHQVSGDLDWLPGAMTLVCYIVFSLIFGFGRVEDISLMKRAGALGTGIVLIVLFGGAPDWSPLKGLFDGLLHRHYVAFDRQVCNTLPPHILYRDAQDRCMVRKQFVLIQGRHHIWLRGDADMVHMIPAHRAISTATDIWAEGDLPHSGE